MNVPSNRSNHHLSLGFNSNIEKPPNLSLPVSQPSPPTQSDSNPSSSTPQVIKYGIQIITANAEDSSSPSLGNLHHNKALLGADLNPTISQPQVQNTSTEGHSRSPRRPNYLQKSSFHNSLSPNPESRSKPAQSVPALSPIHQYYNALSPRAPERKTNSIFEPEHDNKSNASFNQDGPFLPRTKSNVDSKNFLDSLNISRDFDGNDYFVQQNDNNQFMLNKLNKSTNEDNHGENIRRSKSNSFLNQQQELDNSQDDELFANLDGDLKSGNENIFGGSAIGSEDGFFNKNNLYNMQPFVQVNKNQEQGIPFNRENSNQINEYMYQQQSIPLDNNSLPNRDINNPMLTNSNNNFNNNFTFNLSNINQNANPMVNKSNNHLNYKMNMNMGSNMYLNSNNFPNTNQSLSPRITNQQISFNRNQPLHQQQQPQQQSPQPDSNYNYQRMFKPHNTHNLAMPSIYRLDNIEIAKQAHNLAKDQSGCRFLQKKIEDETDYALSCIYPVILDHLLDTVNDQFGNYLIQKFFEYLSPQEINHFLNLIGPSFATIGINQYGTRVLQKIIDFLPNEPDNLALFKSFLIPNIVLFSNDVNGCHIIQKILTTKLFDNSFIYHHLDLHIEHIANHKNGCCFLQKCTEKLTGIELEQILNAVDKKAKILIIDQYGNYVIQHVMKINGAQRNYNLFMILINNLSYYSNQKFSSNVIEKFFVYDEFKRIIIEKMLNQQLMREMLFDGFGNYVVQRALANATQDEQIKLLYFIAPLMDELKTLNFGAKLYHKLTTQYPMIVNMMMSYRNNDSSNNS